MAKIPFDVKYRPQIESGEYKVETESGTPAKIIDFEWNNKHTGVCLAVKITKEGKDTGYLYTEYGKRAGIFPYEKDSDLFIVTPEPELTEFEQEVRECVTKNLTTHIKDGNGREMSSTVFIDDETAKKMTAELLDLARKEIEEELKEKVLHDYWKQASDQCAQARKDGKDEALKDLPRWRKWENGAAGNGCGIPLAIVKREPSGYKLVDALGIPGEQYIMLSDLKKLSGFNED